MEQTKIEELYKLVIDETFIITCVIEKSKSFN